MKKFMLFALLLSWANAADNDLYDNSIALNVGYASTAADATTYSGVTYGLQINQNLNVSEGAQNIDALQFTIDYANLNSYKREYALRLGSNALWYLENNEAWTPFFKAVLGVQFMSGMEDQDFGDHFFGTLGAGMEYQMRGDTSWVGEVTDHLSATGENTVRLSIGLKYSFGQGY